MDERAGSPRTRSHRDAGTRAAGVLGEGAEIHQQQVQCDCPHFPPAMLSKAQSGDAKVTFSPPVSGHHCTPPPPREGIKGSLDPKVISAAFLGA